jgi:hypothetical protein
MASQAVDEVLTSRYTGTMANPLSSVLECCNLLCFCVRSLLKECVFGSNPSAITRNSGQGGGMSFEWNYPGARWWKFDFHAHTPASKDTYWARNSVALTPETWLLKYMAAEIDCVAVTDHNSGDWIDLLKNTYREMKRQADAGSPPAGFRELYLFPGVEISVHGGLHLLAIFAPDCASSTIISLLGGVGFPSGLHGETDCSTDAACSRDSIILVIEEIQRCGGLAIPAHTDLSKGLLETTGATQQGAKHPDAIRSALKSDLLGIEVVHQGASKPDLFKSAQNRWAEVLGSDCHSFRDPAIPGSRFTWVKMESPSLEGLRLALLDGQGVSIRRSDDAVPFSPFALPEHFIESIEIANARYMGGGGHPELLRFNPSFNALVGGRGTGKSTIVHALRLAYRRDQELLSGTDAADTFTRFVLGQKGHKESGGVLPESRIAVTVSRDGIRHRLLWNLAGKGPAVEDWDDSTGAWVISASQAITEQRFPLRLFSQGQIAALAGESQQALLQVVDEAAGTDEAQQAFNDAKRAFFTTRAKQRELKGTLNGREALNLSLQDVQRKLARFEAEHHAEILKSYQRTSRQRRELDRQFNNVMEMAQRLQAMSANLQAEDVPDGLFDTQADAEALNIAQLLASAVSQTKAQIEAAAQHLIDSGETLRTQLSLGRWQQSVEQSRLNYDTLKTALLSQGVNDPHEYGRLVQDRQRLETEATRLDALQKQLDELKDLAKVQRDAVWQARRQISARRARFLQLTLENNSFVRIGLIPYSRDSQAIERSLRELLGIAEKFKDDIYSDAQGEAPAKGLIADLLGNVNLIENPKHPDTMLFEDEIKNLQIRLAKACKGSGDFGGWFNKFLVAEAEKRPEFIDQILCWFPDDGLRVEYSRNGDGKDFQPIEQASAGQRAAAMLAFLLSHGSEPLVLDQPEDDLDNHLIYGLVVQQIRTNKQHRQLIIVTHNPNIVVNGDAEMIHALEFKQQCTVSQSGSLQKTAMRDEVCKVMEGGKEAFERRYLRLGREI